MRIFSSRRRNGFQYEKLNFNTKRDVEFICSSLKGLQLHKAAESKSDQQIDFLNLFISKMLSETFSTNEIELLLVEKLNKIGQPCFYSQKSECFLTIRCSNGICPLRV